MEHEDVPDGTRTPPTPPARSPPPPSPPPSRIPAVAHLRPVSIPDIVRDMAGKDTRRKPGILYILCILSELYQLFCFSDYVYQIIIFLF